MPQQSRQDVWITFGMIVLNGEPFVKYNLRALYPFAHQIIVVEGAAPSARSVASAGGHSLDGTLEALRAFKAEEDPENKLIIVVAEDDGHADGFWEEKDEMSNAYAKRATGNYLWQTDVDEFYLPEDMQAVIEMLRDDPEITAVSFPVHTFWGALNYTVNGFFLAKTEWHRLFAWGPGYRYVAHRPPTVIDDKSRNLRTLRWITPREMKRRAIYLQHYELLFPKQVFEKCQYYASLPWTSELRKADRWVKECYLSLSRPFRVHMLYNHLSWFETYSGGHHPEVAKMVSSVAAGVHSGVALRRLEDVDALLAKPGYRLQRMMLRMGMPFDRAAAAVKTAARSTLKDSALWHLLQASKKRIAAQRSPFGF